MQERQKHPQDHQKQSKVCVFQFSKASSKFCGFQFLQEISEVCDVRFSATIDFLKQVLKSAIFEILKQFLKFAILEFLNLFLKFAIFDFLQQCQICSIFDFLKNSKVCDFHQHNTPYKSKIRYRNDKNTPSTTRNNLKIAFFQFSKAISKVCGFQFSQEISKVCDVRFSKLCLVLHPSVSPVCWALQTVAKVQESHVVDVIAQALFELSDLVLAAAEDEHWLVLRVALDILEKTAFDENDIRRKRYSTKTSFEHRNQNKQIFKYSYSTCKQPSMMAGTAAGSAPATATGRAPATAAGPATAGATTVGPANASHSSVVPATRKTTSRPCFRIGSQL